MQSSAYVVLLAPNGSALKNKGAKAERTLSLVMMY